MFVRICSMAACLTLLLVASSQVLAQQWGDLTGQIVYGGTPPKSAAIKITKDVEVCGKHNLVDESLVVNPENKGIKNVLVYLYISPRSTDVVKVHPDYAKTATEEVTLNNTGCRYEPQVVLLRTTQTLVIGNKDPIGHNTKIDTLKNAGINPIIPAMGSMKHKFPKAESRPAPVSCNIHTWMKAKLMVLDHPYMAATDADGKFTIKNLPTGKLTFQFRHDKYLTAVKKGGAAEKWSKGRTDITIKPGVNDLGVIEVPASAF